MKRLLTLLLLFFPTTLAVAQEQESWAVDALFIHQDSSRGTADAMLWQEVLREYAVECRLISKSELGELGLGVFSDVEVVLVGAATAERPEDKDIRWFNYWGDPRLVDIIVASKLPILGLSNGGLTLFGQMGLPVGGGYFAHGTAQTFALAEDSHKYLRWPFEVDSEGPIEISTREQSMDGYYQAPSYIESILKQPDSAYYPVVRFQHYAVWGAGPDAGYLTESGRRLFTNIVHDLAHSP